MITDTHLKSLRLVFKPEPKLGLVSNRRTTLMLYSKRFALLLDDMSRVEFRYSSSFAARAASDEEHEQQGDEETWISSGNEITRVIGSRDVVANKWNELIITDASSESQRTTNLISGMERIVLVTPDKIQLSQFGGSRLFGRQNFDNNNNTATELFVAGLPDAIGNIVQQSQNSPNTQSDLSFPTLSDKLVSGFTGCIGGLSINERVYNFRSDLNGDALDGFDIGEFSLRTTCNYDSLSISTLANYYLYSLSSIPQSRMLYIGLTS